MKISSMFRTAIAVLKKPMSLIPLLVVIVSILLATFAYRTLIRTQAYVPTPLTAPIPTLPPSPTAGPTRVASQPGMPIVLPPQDPTQIQGIDVGTSTSADKEYPGISWFRMGYPTCGWGDLKGQKLKDTIQYYHRKGLRVLLTVCQVKNVESLDWNAIAQS